MKCSKCGEQMEKQHQNVYKCYFCGTFGVDVNNFSEKEIERINEGTKHKRIE